MGGILTLFPLANMPVCCNESLLHGHINHMWLEDFCFNDHVMCFTLDMSCVLFGIKHVLCLVTCQLNHFVFVMICTSNTASIYQIFTEALAASKNKFTSLFICCIVAMFERTSFRGRNQIYCISNL